MLGLLMCIGYFSVARFASESYPFSKFPMFDHPGDSASRIVARTPDGRLRELSAFDHWECDRQPSADFHACLANMPFDYSPHVDGDLLRSVTQHQGHGANAQPVEVVRHIWRFKRHDKTRTEDCVLAKCRATLK